MPSKILCLGGLIVLLAGLRPELCRVLGNPGFAAWYSADRFLLKESESWSATVRAVRRDYGLPGTHNTCAHCAGRASAHREAKELISPSAPSAPNVKS